MNEGCEFYADALIGLARGELDPGRVAQLETHLDTCEACRAELEAIRAVRTARAPMPEGLESRIQAAVRDRAPAGAAPGPTIRLVPPRAKARWRPWALPLAAAAALALWLGGKGLGVIPSQGTDGGTTTVSETEYDTYGVWPASDGVVAGDLVLSELTVDELEALLEEMQR